MPYNKNNMREERFCELMATGKMSEKKAFIEAGYSPNSADANACRMMGKERVKAKIHAIKVELAVKMGINRETQAKKLEDLRLRCSQEGDNTNEVAAIREENKLFGLSIDKQATVMDAEQVRLGDLEAEEARRYGALRIQEELRKAQERASEDVETENS